MERYYVGIDAGSVSVNAVLINEQAEIVFEHPYTRHFGKVSESVCTLLQNIYSSFGFSRITAVAFTGNHGRVLSKRLGGFYEFESIAQVLGSVHLLPDVRTIIAMGGQDTALYLLSHRDGRWELDDFTTNTPCASGTGSFIDQQAERLASSLYETNIDTSDTRITTILEDFIALGMTSTQPARVACRCTVFTKSDMIHLQNKGEKLADIIAGLHVGNASNYVSTLVSHRRCRDPVLFIGGLSMNELQVRAFRRHFPDVIVPDYSTSVGALGVALQARDHAVATKPTEDELITRSEHLSFSYVSAPALRLVKTHFPESNAVTVRTGTATRIPAFLGIDIGSTTTKYALIDAQRNIIDKEYRQTMGKPVEVTQTLLKVLKERNGDAVDVRGVATTGSGRMVVGDFLNADVIIDEITAHARGATEIDPAVDTIFEIGGQDSKYIALSNTYPLDFDMNKVCAAGTGSFLHELASKNGVNIVDEFQNIALSSDRPVTLTERCTVFMESDIVSYAQKGARTNDLIAGLCYAIVYNYLHRVVGNRKIGRRIMFLGGPSLNKAIVAAFEAVLGTGLIIPRHREVLGGFGAAVSVQEKMARDNAASSARNFTEAITDTLEFTETVCHADPACHNECKLKIYNFSGRKSVWGGECGRYEMRAHAAEKKENLFALRDAVWERHLAGLYVDLGDITSNSQEGEGAQPLLEVDGRPTVGMQRALYNHHLGLFWAVFFDELGYRAVLTPKTNDRISQLGIESMTTETCFPVKVSHGHLRELRGKTRYLFLPSIIDLPNENGAHKHFYCPLVQGNYYMLRAAVNLEDTDVLHPTVHLNALPEQISLELHDHMGRMLGVSRHRIRDALDRAVARQLDFENELYERGERCITLLDNEEPLLVVTGRPYNLFDERLNLRLGQNLSKIGVTAVPVDFIDVRNVDVSDFPNMYWAYGHKVLQAAKHIKMTANFFGLHLTNFSCGPDSFNEHFYSYIMGDKPYLILELDEHTAVAGIMTRLEAFKNVILSVRKMASRDQEKHETSAAGS